MRVRRFRLPLGLPRLGGWYSVVNCFPWSLRPPPRVVRFLVVIHPRIMSQDDEPGKSTSEGSLFQRCLVRDVVGEHRVEVLPLK
jgi:hypothetical protein